MPKDESLVTRELLFQLLVSEERYQNFMNAATDSIFINNLEGLFLDANYAACDVLGYTHKEITSMSVWDIEVGFSKETIHELSLKLTQGPLNVEGIHRRKDGTTFPVDVRMNAFKSMGETMILAIARDLSEEKNAESIIKRLSYALDQTSSLVIIINKTNKIEYVNEKVIAKTGYAYHELIGQHPQILQAGKASIETFNSLWEQLSDKKSWNGELLNTTKSGECYWVSAIISPIFDKEEKEMTHYLAIMEPISKKK